MTELFNGRETDITGNDISMLYLESKLPLTKASLNYICAGNDTDEITFVGVLHAIRAVSPIVVQIK